MRRNLPGGANASPAELESEGLDGSPRAILAVKLIDLINERGLSQTEAAHVTGMTQSRISLVRSRKLQNISLERLMQALVSLDQRVEIVVRPARSSRLACIRVAG